MPMGGTGPNAAAGKNRPVDRRVRGQQHRKDVGPQQTHCIVSIGPDFPPVEARAGDWSAPRPLPGTVLSSPVIP